MRMDIFKCLTIILLVVNTFFLSAQIEKSECDSIYYSAINTEGMVVEDIVFYKDSIFYASKSFNSNKTGGYIIVDTTRDFITEALDNLNLNLLKLDNDSTNSFSNPYQMLTIFSGKNYNQYLRSNINWSGLNLNSFFSTKEVVSLRKKIECNKNEVFFLPKEYRKNPLEVPPFPDED